MNEWNKRVNEWMNELMNEWNDMKWKRNGMNRNEMNWNKMIEMRWDEMKWNGKKRTNDMNEMKWNVMKMNEWFERMSWLNEWSGWINECNESKRNEWIVLLAILIPTITSARDKFSSQGCRQISPKTCLGSCARVIYSPNSANWRGSSLEEKKVGLTCPQLFAPVPCGKRYENRWKMIRWKKQRCKINEILRKTWWRPKT